MPTATWVLQLSLIWLPNFSLGPNCQPSQTLRGLNWQPSQTGQLGSAIFYNYVVAEPYPHLKLRVIAASGASWVILIKAPFLKAPSKTGHASIVNKYFVLV